MNFQVFPLTVYSEREILGSLLVRYKVCRNKLYFTGHINSSYFTQINSHKTKLYEPQINFSIFSLAVIRI